MTNEATKTKQICTCQHFWHNPSDHDVDCPVSEKIDCGLDDCPRCSPKRNAEKFGVGIMTNDIGPLP